MVVLSKKLFAVEIQTLVYFLCVLPEDSCTNTVKFLQLPLWQMAIYISSNGLFIPHCLLLSKSNNNTFIFFFALCNYQKSPTFICAVISLQYDSQYFNMTYLFSLEVMMFNAPLTFVIQDGDESSPISTSSEIVKIPDPQMCMVSPYNAIYITVLMFRFS